MVSQIYPTNLQLNNSFDSAAPFLDLNLSITNDIVSSKIYDKWDDFKFEIVNYPFLMEMFLALLHMMYMFRSIFIWRAYGLILFN